MSQRYFLATLGATGNGSPAAEPASSAVNLAAAVATTAVRQIAGFLTFDELNAMLVTPDQLIVVQRHTLEVSVRSLADPLAA